MVLIAFALAGILLYRLFQLQIVRGEEYLNNFILESRKPEKLRLPEVKFLTGTERFSPTMSLPIP